MSTLNPEETIIVDAHIYCKLSRWMGDNLDMFTLVATMLDMSVHLIRPNKKIPVFRVTRPYLNILVKPIFFQVFWEKNILLCILKGEMPFKMHKLYFSRLFFPEKKTKKKQNKICVPTLPKSFRPVTRHTLIFLIWPKNL